MWYKAALLLVLAWFLPADVALVMAAEENQTAVIIPRGSTPPDLSHDDLALIYKRKKRIMGGLHAQPVNLPVNNPSRQFFSQKILHHSPEELEDYWRDMYFNGVLPPYVLASEEAVIRFVAATPGAIGYVPKCLADHRVTVVILLDGGPACPK